MITKFIVFKIFLEFKDKWNNLGITNEILKVNILVDYIKSRDIIKCRIEYDSAPFILSNFQNIISSRREFIPVWVIMRNIIQTLYLLHSRLRNFTNSVSQRRFERQTRWPLAIHLASTLNANKSSICVVGTS